MRATHRIALALLLLLVFVAPVAAQSPVPPTPPPPDPPEQLPAWTTLPDAVGYVQYFHVPQCNECDTQAWVGVPDSTPFPPLGDILNPIFYLGELFRWVMSGISNLVRMLICTLLVILKLLADIIVVVVDLVLVALNVVYRLIILIWMLLKYLILFLAYIIQALMDVLMMLFFLIQLLAYYIILIIYMVLQALTLVIVLAIAIVQLLNNIGQIIAWLVSLVLHIVVAIFEAMRDTAVPTDLHPGAAGSGGAMAGLGGHPAFSFMRGVLDGFIADPRVGWLYYLTIGAVWFAFAVSIVKRFGRAQG